MLRLVRFVLLVLVCMPSWSAPTTDRFWAIGLENNSMLYWKTHKVGDSTEVYDACNSTGKPAVVAKATSDSSWALAGTYGNLTARLNPDGMLVLTIGNKPFGTGQRIAPVTTCVDGVPTKIRMIDVAPAERSFAQMTGDATHLEQAVGVALPTVREPAPPAPSALAPTHEVLPSGGTLDCSGSPVALKAVRQLANTNLLGSEKNVWPGALLQGKDFVQGKLTPITIARGPGRIWLTGINIDVDQALSAKLPAVTEKEVTAAVAKLASQNAKSIEASFDFSIDVVYSAEQMAYTFGLDGRLGGGNATTRIGNYFTLDPSPNKNAVLIRFTQTYFTASLEAPPSRFSVFADKKNLKDPHNEMGPTNPPLLVSSVAYGRSIYLLAQSPFEVHAVMTAITAAIENKPDGTVMSSGRLVPYSEILKQTKFLDYTLAVGGGYISNKLFTLQNSVANTPQDLWKMLKAFLNELKTSPIADWDKGVPVKYTVSYLTNRATASMGFATAYNRKNCVIEDKKLASFKLNIFGVDDSYQVHMTGPDGKSVQVYQGARSPNVLDLDNFIPDNMKDKNFEVRIELYNIAGPSGLDFQLTRTQFSPNQTETAWDGQSSVMKPLGADPLHPAPYMHIGGSWNVGWIALVKFQINRSTGEVKRIL